MLYEVLQPSRGLNFRRRHGRAPGQALRVLHDAHVPLARQRRLGAQACPVIPHAHVPAAAVTVAPQLLDDLGGHLRGHACPPVGGRIGAYELGRPTRTQVSLEER